MKHKERELFRSAVGKVAPTKSDRVPHSEKRPKPIPRQTLADEKLVLTELLTHDYDPASLESGEEIFFLRPGIQKRVMRKLRRGGYSVGAILDLHHMNAEAAEEHILAFVAECQTDGITCARIIHGKGLRSKSQGPVLKRLTEKTLRRHPEVLAFASARPWDGGTGAVYLLLRR